MIDFETLVAGAAFQGLEVDMQGEVLLVLVREVYGDDGPTYAVSSNARSHFNRSLR